jgi:hypothetical protein
MLRRFVDWQVSTFTQERLDIAIAIVAFLALIGLGFALREYLGGDGALTAGASVAVALGSSLWIVGNVMELGGHRALELFARTGNDLGPFDAIQFTVAEIDDWFELTGFALIGVGILAFAAAGRSRYLQRPRERDVAPCAPPRDEPHLARRERRRLGKGGVLEAPRARFVERIR